jgi:hypothetical protein
MVAALNDFQPEALTAYPSVAAALAEEQLQGRLRIAPAMVATTSEVQTADMRRRMAEAWGLAPLDFYGTTEALVPAAGRQGQTGMDILEGPGRPRGRGRAVPPPIEVTPLPGSTATPATGPGSSWSRAPSPVEHGSLVLMAG